MVDLIVPTSYGYGIGRIDANTTATLAAPRTCTKAEYDRAKAVRIAGQTSDGTSVPNMSSYWSTSDWTLLQTWGLDGIQYFPGHANWNPDYSDPGAPLEPNWRRDLSLAFHWWILDNYCDPIWDSAIVTNSSKLIGFIMKPGNHKITFRGGQKIYTMESGFIHGYYVSPGSDNGANLNTYYVSRPANGRGFQPFWDTGISYPSGAITLYPAPPRFVLQNITVEYDQLGLGGVNRATIKRSTNNLPINTETVIYGTISTGLSTATNCVLADEFDAVYNNNNTATSVKYLINYPAAPDYPLTDWVGKQCLVADLSVKGISDGSTNGKLMPMPPAGGFVTGDNKLPRVWSVDTVNNTITFTTERDYIAGKLSGAPGSTDPAVVLNSGTYVASGTNPQWKSRLAILRPDLTLPTSLIGDRPSATYFRDAGGGDAVIESILSTNITNVNNTTKVITFSGSTPTGSLVEPNLGTFDTYKNWIYDVNHDGTKDSGIIPQGYQATISSESNGLALPQGTIKAIKTLGTIPSGAGRLQIVATNGGKTYVSYNSISSSTVSGVTTYTFSGCTGGTGTIATGDLVTWMPNNLYTRMSFSQEIVFPRSKSRDNLENSVVRIFSPGDLPPGAGGVADPSLPGKMLCQNITHQNGILDGGNSAGVDNAYNNKQFWYNVGGFGGYNIIFQDMEFNNAASDFVSLWPRGSIESAWSQWNTHWKFLRCNMHTAGRHAFVLHSCSDLVIDSCSWSNVEHWVFDNESANGRMIGVKIINCTTDSGGLGWFSGAPQAVEISPWPRAYSGATLTPGSKVVTFPNAPTTSAQFALTPYGQSHGDQVGADILGDLQTGTYFSPGTYIVSCPGPGQIELNKPPTVSTVVNGIDIIVGYTQVFRDYTVDNNKFNPSGGKPNFKHKFNWPKQQGFNVYYGSWTKRTNKASDPQPNIIQLDAGQTTKLSWLSLNPEDLNHTIPGGGNMIIGGVGPASYPANADIHDCMGLGGSGTTAAGYGGIDVTLFNGSGFSGLFQVSGATKTFQYGKIAVKTTTGWAILSYTGNSGMLTGVTYVSGSGLTVVGAEVFDIQRPDLIPTGETRYLPMLRATNTAPNIVPPNLTNLQVLMVQYRNSIKQADKFPGFLGTVPAGTPFGIPEVLVKWHGFTFSNNDHGPDGEWNGADSDYPLPSMLSLAKNWTEVNVFNNNCRGKANAGRLLYIVGYYDIAQGSGAHNVVNPNTHVVDSSLLPVYDGETMQYFVTNNNFDNCGDDQIFTDAPTNLNITSASPNPGSTGTVITFQATLKNDNTVLPGQTVTFWRINPSTGIATSIGTATTDSSGIAVRTTTFSSNGVWPIYATFDGVSGLYGPCTSPQINEIIGSVAVDTTTTVDPGPNPSFLNDTVTFIATVTANTGIPSGVVTFLLDGIDIGSANLNEAGIASFDWTYSNSGVRTIEADYQGISGQYLASSGTASVVVMNGRLADEVYNITPPADGFDKPHI